MTRFWKVLVLLCVSFMIFTGIFLMVNISQINTRVTAADYNISYTTDAVNKVSQQLEPLTENPEGIQKGVLSWISDIDDTLFHIDLNTIEK